MTHFRIKQRSKRHISMLAAAVVSFCGIAPDAYAQGTVTETSNDTVTRNLSEVVISAKKEIHTDEADILYLSKENRRFGTNALDAISSLRQFSPVINGMGLATAAQKPVAIMINGNPATPQDLRGYTGSEIKKVTYYPVAPPRYSYITDGPLVDVTVKVESNFINAFVSASHSLNVGYGTDQAVVRWADSLNMVRADYFIDYRNLRYRDSYTYIYPSSPALSRNFAGNGKYRGNFQYGKLSWQNTAHNNFFYVSAMFSHSPAHRDYDNRRLPDPGSFLADGDGHTDSDSDVSDTDGYSRHLESNSDMGSLNLFYRLNAGKGLLDLQANGSVGKSSSDNSLVYGDRPGFATDFTNRTTTAFGRAAYTLPVRTVTMLFSGSFRHQHTGYDGRFPERLDYSTGQNNAVLTASFFGRFMPAGRRLSYTLGLSMNYQDINSDRYGIDISHCRFTPNLTLSSLVSKKVFLRLRGYIRSGVPGIGELSDVPTFQESNLAWRGDRSLKGWTIYGGALMAEYAPIQGRLSFNGEVEFQYYKDPVKPCVFAGSPVEVRYVNIPYLRETQAVLNINATPFRNFSIRPYFEVSHNSFTTPSAKIDRGYFRYGGSLILNTGRFQSTVSANCPYKVYNGDVMEYGGWQFACSVLANLPAGLSLSVDWRRSYQNDRTEIYAPGILEYVSRSHYPRMANQIGVTLSWSFSKGIFKKRQQLNVEDAQSDSGISDFNKATM